jgi:hypothetical protein
MAAAVPLPPDNLTMGLDSYPRRLTITDVDFADTRYPTVGSSSSKHRPTPSFSDRPTETLRTEASRASWIDFSSSATAGRLAGFDEAWVAGKFTEESCHQPQAKYHREDAETGQVESTRLPDGADVRSPSGKASPYLPPDTFEERLHRNPSYNVSSGQELSRGTFDTGSPLQNSDMGQRSSGLDQYRDHQYTPSSPKHPALPAVGVGASTSDAAPIVPMSAGPSYSSVMAIPISPKPRAYAQQPTYITPSPAPNPINPMYSQPQVLKEDVCIECAMRDQDMADVDATSPGVWRRDSDVDYEELLRRELEEEAMGMPYVDNPSRPRARGGRLTEENLKLWTSIVRDIFRLLCGYLIGFTRYVEPQRAFLQATNARSIREIPKGPVGSGSVGTCSCHA